MENYFSLQANGTRTKYLWLNPDTKQYEVVCDYFTIRGITYNIPRTVGTDEAVYDITESQNSTRELRISLEDLTDFKMTAKSCARQHFIINGKFESIIYHFLLGLARKAMNFHEYIYQHSCLGWQSINNKDYFLLEENILEDGNKSHCILDFGRFTNGSENDYDSMLESYIYNRPELCLAYTLSFTGVIVSRIAAQKSIPNLCVGLSGRSGSGKTTAAKLIASVWADPDNCKGGLIMNNDASEVGFSAQYSGFFGVPVIFDDTDAESNIDLTKYIYRMSKGTQRVVSNSKGEVDRSRLGMSGIFIFTSETSILEKTDKTMGLYARYLDLSDVSWTKDAESSDIIQNCCSENFGFKGKRFASYMERFDINKLYQAYDIYYKQVLSKITKKDSMTSRSAKKYAVIALTAKLVNKCFNININIDTMIKMLLSFENKQVQERDKGKLAYLFLHDFFIDHYRNFHVYRNGQLEYMNDREHNTNYGYASYKGDDLHLYIPTITCKKILESNGFIQVDNYKKFWKEQGLTKCPNNSERYDCSATGKLYMRHFHFVYEKEFQRNLQAMNNISLDDEIENNTKGETNNDTTQQ